MALNTFVYFRRGEASHLLTYLTFCFAGMQLSLWYRRKVSTRQLVFMIAVVAVATLRFAAYYKIGVVAFTLCSFLLLWWAINRKDPKFNLPIFGFVGTIFYSWYHYHAAMGYPLLSALHGGSFLVTLGVIILAFIVTPTIAWLSYRFVERPGIELGRKLERHVAPLRAHSA
jgi:peptidoglycan/LPS O-acetylase OafA/YrhL